MDTSSIASGGCDTVLLPGPATSAPMGVIDYGQYAYRPRPAGCLSCESMRQIIQAQAELIATLNKTAVTALKEKTGYVG